VADGRRSWRFDGQILGVGTTSGTRVVVGHWWRSPFGAFADAMVEEPQGRRVLVAPAAVAGFVAATYRFDEVVEADVRARTGHDARGGRWLSVAGGPLGLRADVGRRTAVGHLLRLLPAAWATSPAFSFVTDPVARLAMDGVRTRGVAGPGRRESYGATDVHEVVAVRAAWDGTDLGALAPVHPPVRFGFGSTPRRPSLTRVVTTVRETGRGDPQH
jgi:hypothetical protein